MVFAHFAGEHKQVATFVYGTHEIPSRLTTVNAFSLLGNGAIAFLLNVVSFTANKKTSALTMTVAANVKQVMSIVLSVMIFNLTVTPLNALGIAVTLAGGMWYTRVELQSKNLTSADGLVKKQHVDADIIQSVKVVKA